MRFDADDDRVLETRVRDLCLDFSIGVLPEEHLAPQPVRIDLAIFSMHEGRHDSEDLGRYVSYATVIDAVRRLAREGGHVELVETLAERICDLALADPRVLRVRVTVDKPTIIPEAGAVGVTVQRTRRS
jgi:dihydroneopterin aldolase